MNSPLTISRRTAMQQFAGLMATGWMLAEPTSVRAATPRPISKIELAIATICTDGFGDQQHGPAFQVIPKLGFTNVEFNVWHANMLTPQYMQSIQDRCQATGLKAISLQGTEFSPEGRTGILKEVAHKVLLMNYAKHLSCNVVKFTGAARDTCGGLPAVIQICRELVSVAEQLNVFLVLENHANNVIETIDDYDQIFSAIDSPYVGMCFDMGHFEGVGIDLHQVIKRFAPKILHVDLKDCKARGQGHQTVPFGQGVTDFDGVLNHLVETGYQGYLVVEQAWREPKGNWQNDLQAGYQRFQKWE